VSICTEVAVGLALSKLRILRKDQDALLRERASVYESSLAIECISCKTLMKELDVPFLTCTRRTIYRGRGRGRDGCPALRDEISALLLSYYWRDLERILRASFGLRTLLYFFWVCTIIILQAAIAGPVPIMMCRYRYKYTSREKIACRYENRSMNTRDCANIG
jgi:hypothetical protein